ncbi:hypothetical protein GCM10009760_53030 [Kitasatospora kazusensis]|uniref:Uncharacterized protein n=1 Tax=Kitasatospora kazusensis TaxID=407974 RepID=A0ABN3A5G0_9ACTN
MTQHQNQPTDPASGTLREAAARRAQQLTAPGGWSDRRRRELVAALDDFSTAQPWVRALAYALALAAGALVLGTVGGILLNAAAALVGAVHLPQHIPGTGDGLATTITRPVHTYLDSSSGHLPLTATTAYAAWKTFGLAAGFLAFASQAAMARLAWTTWSAATLAMVWQAAPEAGRPVATGLTAAAIIAVSLFALRGISFSLRPLVINRTDVQPQITIQTPERTRHCPTGPFDQR